MNFSVKIKPKAAKELGAINMPERLRIIAAIDGLATNPYRGSALKGDLLGLRRIRVGNFRMIYEIDDGFLRVLVIKAGHRREVYRDT